MMESLAAYTKTGGKNPSLIRNFQSSGISFQGGAVRVGTDKHFHIYPNIYLFEHQYLEPKIRRLKSAASNVTAAIRRKGQPPGKVPEAGGNRCLLRLLWFQEAHAWDRHAAGTKGERIPPPPPRQDDAFRQAWMPPWGTLWSTTIRKAMCLPTGGPAKAGSISPLGKVEFPYGQSCWTAP